MIYCSRKFWFGQNRDFLALLLLPVAAGGPKDGKHFDANWRLISSASFHTSPLQIIVKGIRRNETAIKAVRKKPLRHWCGWGDLVQLSLVKQNLLQRGVRKLLNEPPYGRQNQTKRCCMFIKTSTTKSWQTFVMIHSIEIAFFFMSFKCLRLECEQIR